jgi:hypothetical protein
MKYIWLGIKDYFKDCWHDFLFRNLCKFYKKCVIFFISDGTGVRNDLSFWKEGNLWHYIQQRRIAKRKGNDNQCKNASLATR